MFTNPSTPNLTDFTTFVYNQGVPSADLPTTSDYLQWAFDWGVNITLLPPADMPAILYVLACYNIGMHQLLKIAQDVSGQSFFTQQRAAFSLLGFTAGVIGSSGDQGTADSLVTSEYFKGLTLSALDALKTPWGREYLDYSQQYGSTIIGVS